MKIVLVADDERGFRETVKRLVETTQERVVVYEAGSGHEAVALCRQLRPDVLLLDVWMPDGNGLEAARRIREEWPGARILMCSVHAHPACQAAALAAGADDFIPKKALGARLPQLLRELWNPATDIGDPEASPR